MISNLPTASSSLDVIESQDLDAFGFVRPQRQPIAAHAVLDWITERSTPEQLDFLAIGQPHFEESHRDRIFAEHFQNPSPLARH